MFVICSGREGMIEAKLLKGKEAEGQKYKDYFEWTEPISKTPSHRLLAMRRGEKEGILVVGYFSCGGDGYQLT